MDYQTFKDKAQRLIKSVVTKDDVAQTDDVTDEVELQ